MRGHAAVSIHRLNQSEERSMVLHGRLGTAPRGYTEIFVFGGEFLIDTNDWGLCWHLLGSTYLTSYGTLAPSKILIALV